MSTPTTPSTNAVSATPANARLPSDSTLRQAAKLGIVEDRPIMMDYWSGSIEKSVMIGVKNDETKEKMLVRNAEEYTSPIQKIFKVEQEYIILTENSIYLVDVGIPTRSISA
jgi:hypothetical protein